MAAIGAIAVTLVLASGSSRRAELLTQVGLSFDVLIPGVDESLFPGEQPDTYVSRMAKEKADQAFASFAASCDDVVLLAADTIVVVDGSILGKPGNRQDGLRMLTMLSGRGHEVKTAVHILSADKSTGTVVTTTVNFRRIERVECENYWLSGESHDKAGGYGIQGLAAIFVESITGSYSNVVGLPLAETSLLLSTFGVECLSRDAVEESKVEAGFKS